MLTLNEISPAPGAKKTKTRIGRGNGSGYGKTAGRGHNGAKSRSGYSRKEYFEGGQLPIIKRLPKRGFTNIFKKQYQIVNLSDLNELAQTNDVIDKETLFKAGKINSDAMLLKVLGDGNIEKAVTVKADAFSKSAEEKITAANGKIEVTSRA